MENTRSSFSFENGKVNLFDVGSQDPGTISIIKGIKFALSPCIVRNKLSGKIDIVTDAGRLQIKYSDIKPAEYTSTLMEELRLSYPAAHAEVV